MSDPNQPNDDPPQFSPEGQSGPMANHGDTGGQRKGFRLASMTIADMLDATVKLFQNNWKAVLLLGLVLAVPSAVLSVVTDVISKEFISDVESSATTSGDPSDIFGGAGNWAALGLSGLATVIVYLLVTPLISGAITRVVAASYLGREIDAKVALRSMVPFWLTLIGAAFLSGLATGLGLLLCIVGVVIPLTLFAVVYPAIAVEELGAVDALKRSWHLMSRRLGMYLLTLVVAYLIAIIFAQITGGVIGAIGGLVPGIFGSLIVGVGSLVSNLIQTPILAIVATLMYFDARVRFEGFDVEMMNARVQSDPAGPRPAE